MKRTTLLILLAAFIFLPAFKNEKKKVKNTNAVTAVPLHRLRDLYGYHFYTTNEAEKNSCLKDLGFVYEGITGYVFPQQVAGTVPLFRYRSVVYYWVDYNSENYVITARHFYTTNQNDDELKFKEYDMTNNGKKLHFGSYISEGIQGYISTSQVEGTTPIYKLFKTKFFDIDASAKIKSSPGSYDWFYTTNEEEKFSAVNKYNFTERGLAGYMWTSAVTK